MIGSANRLWRFDVGAVSYVVKELSHESVEHIDRRRRAAAFERAVFEAGELPMPEPLFDRHHDIVTLADGSRGGRCLVRVHRWFEGRPAADVSPSLAEAAGQALAVIHHHGGAWSTERSGSLRWWDQDPMVVASRLEGSSLSDIAGTATALMESALQVIGGAESIEGEWIYSHSDHKPQNALVVDEGVAVLDWDECGHCHPRLEAVESALRWAVASKDAPGAFRAFLGGYGGLSQLEERDFGKWLAALLGWFSFQARRTLGDWPTDTAFERMEAEEMAREAIVELEGTLKSLSLWASWG
jgi:Ser/Thr protein kinase RdoA (MazF antagonist)